jgi:hypothetical protein
MTYISQLPGSNSSTIKIVTAMYVEMQEQCNTRCGLTKKVEVTD